MASKGVIKSKVKSTVSLNDRQKQFCIEYLIDLNATQAYIRAYGENVEVESARRMASKLLTNLDIKKYINDVIDSYTDNIDITVAEIVNNLKSIAMSDSARHSDRIKASELLAKYKGMLVEHKDITVTNTDDKLSKSEIDKQLKALGYGVTIIDDL